MSQTSITRIVFLVCIVIFLCVIAGCTNFNSVKTGDFGSAVGEPGGGTDAGTPGYPGQGEKSDDYNPFQDYNFHLNYKYTDKTISPRYEKYKWPCASECDVWSSYERVDETHVELVMDGLIGHSTGSTFNPHRGITIHPVTTPSVRISGNNYLRTYEWGESYNPGLEDGCSSQPGDTTGGETETITSGHCDNVQVVIPGLDDKTVYLRSMDALPVCQSDETYKAHYWGKFSLPDIQQTTKVNRNGEYDFTCTPYQADDPSYGNFFKSGPGEQTKRDFFLDRNTYKITCSGSKDEVILPGCTGECGLKYGDCWPGGEIKRHQERTLDIIITPVDGPVTLVPLVTTPDTLVPLVPTTTESLAPLVPAPDTLVPLVPGKGN